MRAQNLAFISFGKFFAAECSHVWFYLFATSGHILNLKYIFPTKKSMFQTGGMHILFWKAFSKTVT